MTSLIKECIVLEKIIDKYKEQNRENPCSVCEHASENCLSYLKNGIVPYTGEKIKIEDEKNNENTNEEILQTEKEKTLKSTRRKKPKGKKRR